MEVRKFFEGFVLVLAVASCSNTPELESGEIDAVQLLSQAFSKLDQSSTFIDSRNLLSRKQIDAANIPVLFVELASGQNGTLTPYPGQGVGKTWLGADGATITLDQGILKASRGMGNDIMGSSSSIPTWSEIDKESETYSRQVSQITGNNKIHTLTFDCNIQKSYKKEVLEIWNVEFLVTKFEETCEGNGSKIENIYYLDNQEIIRKSSQYHSETIGYITTERLDR